MRIRDLIKDVHVEEQLSEVEKAAWKSFKTSLKVFLNA
jgi:hypothetical protein